MPSLAKREHSKNLVPLLKRAMKFESQNVQHLVSNKIQKMLAREPELLEQFLEFIPTIKPPKIDAIAVTYGPGLEPALWVGINFAKALALVWDKLLIPVRNI